MIKQSLSASAVLMLLALFALVPSLAQEGPDEYEPDNNRTCDVIYEDQTTIRGEIGGYNDRDDWFALRGEGINTTLTLTFDPNKVEIDWEVIDDGRDSDDWDDHDPITVAYLTNYGSPESVTVQTYGGCKIHLWAYSGQGSYTIMIGEKNCQGFDEVEPNNTKNQADLAVHDIIEGYACPGDSDWFMVNAVSDTYGDFTMHFDDEEVEVDWAVFSDDRQVANDTSYGSPDQISCDIPGTCYIHVWHFSGEGAYWIEYYSYPFSDY